MKTFRMIRHADASGVSGTGHVLSGVVCPSGKVVIEWHTAGGSLGIYESYERFHAIHIASHPGNGTEIVWDACG